MTIKDYTI